jgi:anionic cell wall polymer biosynthesis LytR-Cps2A-Psr (LCP) family protein
LLYLSTGEATKIYRPERGEATEWTQRADQVLVAFVGNRTERTAVSSFERNTPAKSGDENDTDATGVRR